MKELIKDYLKDHPTKRVKTREIEDYLLTKLSKRKYSYREFAATLQELVTEEKLSPVQARGENGRRPRLYNFYWVKESEPKLSAEVRQELLTTYHPQLSISYYLSHPVEYGADKKYIRLLDQFFKANSDKTEISVNERSFQLFNDEKWLTSEQGRQILEHLGIELEDLNCYPTFEPFFYYRKESDRQPKNILILENKDSFFSLKKLLQEGVTSWAGIEFSLLIYGEGKKIQQSFSFFEELEGYCLSAEELTLYYFGDLDPEGINIWWGLARRYEVEFKPFVFFYQQLLELKQEAPKLKTAQQVNKSAVKEFCRYFEVEGQKRIRELFTAGQYLPQEGLNYQLLKELSD